MPQALHVDGPYTIVYRPGRGTRQIIDARYIINGPGLEPELRYRTLTNAVFVLKVVAKTYTAGKEAA